MAILNFFIFKLNILSIFYYITKLVSKLRSVFISALFKHSYTNIHIHIHARARARVDIYIFFFVSFSGYLFHKQINKLNVKTITLNTDLVTLIVAMSKLFFIIIINILCTTLLFFSNTYNALTLL